MKTCHYCRMDIPLAADVCPYCLSDRPSGGHGFITTAFEYILAGLFIWLILAWIF
jgi:hypothetical protein